MSKTPFTFLIVAACLTLTACSGGPSEEDFQRSFNADLQRQANAIVADAQARAGQDPRALQLAQQQAATIRAIQLVQVKKEACEKQQDGSYLCRFHVVANSNGRAVEDQSITHFVKTNDGWVGAQ